MRKKSLLFYYMRRKRNYLYFLLTITLMTGLFLTWAYLKNKNEPIDMTNKLSLITSFYPLYFLTSEIGGDFVEVVNLTPAGREPHDYELTARDMIAVRRSELLILNGGGLEVWEKKIRENGIMKGLNILVMKEKLESRKAGEKILENDPHFWLNPVIASEMADLIAIEIMRIDPKNRDYYQSNLNILKTKLLNLDSVFRRELVGCEKKDFITAHKAFGYLAQEYGLNQISIAGFSPEEEPSPRQLAEISEIARQKGIKYIFFESLINPRLSQVVANEAGAETLVLNPIGGLSAEEIGQGKNYLTEMEKNLENLKKALECD